MWKKKVTMRDALLLGSVLGVTGLFFGYMIAMIQVQHFAADIIKQNLQLSQPMIDEITRQIMTRMGIF